MLTILQKVLEESAPVLVAGRLEAEERRTNMRLREEQDAAYQAALEADQVCNSFNLGFCLCHAVWCDPYGMLPFPFLPTNQVLLPRKNYVAAFLAVTYHFSMLHQARERQKREEQERLEREAAEAERKRKEEEEALERAAREAAEKEAALARMRQEKALSLGDEPEKGPNVTQVKTSSLYKDDFVLYDLLMIPSSHPPCFPR